MPQPNTKTKYRPLPAALLTLVVLLASTLLIWLAVVRPQLGKGRTETLCDNFDRSELLADGDTAAQVFTYDKALYTIGLEFYLPGAQPQGELEVVLSDADTGEELARSTGVMQNIIPDQYTTLGLDPVVPAQEGRRYQLSVTAHYTSDAVLAIGHSNGVALWKEQMTLNGEPVDGTLAMQVTYQRMGGYLTRFFLLVGGAAAVLAFARAGDDVAFTYNAHPDAAEAVLRRAAAAAQGGRFLAIQADAGDSAQVQAAVEQAQRELGSLQVLVCNAGIAQVKLFTDTTDEDWHRMMAVDLDGAFYACRAVLPGMVHQKYGRILLVSSMWGQTGGSCEVAYSAAKAGLIGLGKALAKEEGPSGITVNVIAPGVIDTDMMAGFTAEDRAALAEETPVERLGTADEIARTMVFLADEASGYITGQVLGVNGGLVI